MNSDELERIVRNEDAPIRERMGAKKLLAVENWCKALESGKYKQGTGVLRRGNNYCCLGVAADVLGEEWERRAECFVLKRMPSFYAMLPPDLADKLNLTTETQIRLQSMNDSGVSFAEIAAWIRGQM